MIDLLSDALKWLLAACLGLGAWVWKKTDAKVESMDGSKASKADFETYKAEHRAAMQTLTAIVNSKADTGEMNRQRDNIDTLFTQDSAIRNEMHTNQVSMMGTLNTIAAQVAHIAGRLDSK